MPQFGRTRKYRFKNAKLLCRLTCVHSLGTGDDVYEGTRVARYYGGGNHAALLVLMRAGGRLVQVARKILHQGRLHFRRHLAADLLFGQVES